MSLMDTVKNHPLLIGVTVIGAIIFIIVLRASGNTTQVSQGAVDPAAAAQGTALQIASMQANTQATAINAQLQDDALKYTADAQKSTLEAATQNHLADLAATTAQYQIAAQSDVTKFTSSLAANIQAKQLDTNLQLAVADFDNQQAVQKINSTLQQNITATLADIQKSTLQINDAAAARRENEAYATAQHQTNVNYQVTHEALNLYAR